MIGERRPSFERRVLPRASCQRRRRPPPRDRRADRQTDRQTDEQTDRQTDGRPLEEPAAWLGVAKLERNGRRVVVVVCLARQRRAALDYVKVYSQSSYLNTRPHKNQIKRTEIERTDRQTNRQTNKQTDRQMVPRLTQLISELNNRTEPRTSREANNTSEQTNKQITQTTARVALASRGARRPTTTAASRKHAADSRAALNSAAARRRKTRRVTQLSAAKGH